MTTFRRRIRKLIPAWQDTYFVEPHKYRTGYHVHLFTHRVVPETTVTSTAMRSGFPDPDHIKCEPVLSHRVYGYPLKDARTLDCQDAFRHSNRGQVVHATKDFWIGPDGSPVVGGYESLLREAGR